MKKTKLKATDSIKFRVAVIKAKFAEKNVREISPLFIMTYPEYDNDNCRQRLINVLQLRIADIEYTEKLESLFSKISND